MSVTVFEIGKVSFCLFGTNDLHVKADNERSFVAASLCCQNLKYENFTSSFGRLRQRIVFKCVPHVQHENFSSFNQSDHCFLALSLMLPSSFLKLVIIVN